jgi:tRNA A37 threonylcarbamoyladenosine synthetase subunit TsaC/SUA5/YrdC
MTITAETAETAEIATKTKVQKINFLSMQNLTMKDKKKIQKALIAGASIIYPTDTVYGLGWFPTLNLIEYIDRLKQRPNNKSYSLLAPSLWWIVSHRRWVIPWNNRIEKISFLYERFHTTYKKYWPLTLLLEKNQLVKTWDLKQTIIDALSPTTHIGVRYLSNHPMQSLVETWWIPIITTSANISWQATIQKTSHLPQSRYDALGYMIVDEEREICNHTPRQWSTLVYFPSWEKKERW